VTNSPSFFIYCVKITLCYYLAVVKLKVMIEEKYNTEESLELDRSRLEDSSNNTIVSKLPVEARKKLEVIQTLLEPCDRTAYGHKLREGAMKLGISVRSLQRLFKRYQQEGITALVTIDRRDKGKHRIDDFWQEFIVKTYQQGNKGSKRMNVKQVAIRVEAKAYELKETDYPSYRTVLRVLKPYIEKKNKSIRSPGWQGNSLSVKTRDGFDLDISYSNQVWQCGLAQRVPSAAYPCRYTFSRSTWRLNRSSLAYYCN
jgi:putative transposase